MALLQKVVVNELFLLISKSNISAQKKLINIWADILLFDINQHLGRINAYAYGHFFREAAYYS